MGFPIYMKEAKRWLLRLPGQKDPVSALTERPEGYVGAGKDHSKWRYHWGDVAICVDLPTAVQAIKDNPGKYECVNYSLHHYGNIRHGLRLICFDFDKGLDADKKPKPCMQGFIDSLSIFGDVFVEESRSGGGGHVFVLTECVPFTNNMQRPLEDGVVVDCLCTSQVACTGKVVGGNDKLSPIPYAVLMEWEFFRERNKATASATLENFDPDVEWWAKPNEGIPDEFKQYVPIMEQWGPCIAKHGGERAMIGAAGFLATAGVTGWAGVELLKLIPSYVQDDTTKELEPDPWTVKQLQHKMKEAYGAAVNEGRFGKGPANEFTALPVDAKPPQECVDATDDTKWYLEVGRWVEDLQAEYPQPEPEVIVGVLRAGAVMNMVSHPKFGKTFFVDQLIISYVHNVPFLDTFTFGDAVPRRVLLVDNELPQQEVWDRLNKLCEVMGLPPLPPQSVKVIPLRGRAEHLATIAKAILRYEKPDHFGLFILDSNYQAWQNESDPVEMRMFFNCFSRIVGYLRAAGIGIHHTTKGGQSDKEKTDVGSGSGVITRAADGHCIIRKHEQEGCSVVEFELRSFKCPAPLVVGKQEGAAVPWFKTMPGMDPTKLYNGKAADGTKVPAEVLAFVEKYPNNSAAGIAGTLGVNVALVKDALRAYVEKDIVIASPAPEDPKVIIFRLNPDAIAAKSGFDAIDPAG